VSLPFLTLPFSAAEQQALVEEGIDPSPIRVCIRASDNAVVIEDDDTGFSFTRRQWAAIAAYVDSVDAGLGLDRCDDE
jgi:hypothetical protein